jgi:hypothetical protein
LTRRALLLPTQLPLKPALPVWARAHALLANNVALVGVAHHVPKSSGVTPLETRPCFGSRRLSPDPSISSCSSHTTGAIYEICLVNGRGHAGQPPLAGPSTSKPTQGFLSEKQMLPSQLARSCRLSGEYATHSRTYERKVWDSVREFGISEQMFSFRDCSKRVHGAVETPTMPKAEPLSRPPLRLTFDMN